MVQDLVTIVPWNFVATIANLFLQVYLIKRFLFKPINEVLEKRRAKADAEIQQAVQAKEEAQAMKTEYEKICRKQKTEQTILWQMHRKLLQSRVKICLKKLPCRSLP